MTQDDSPEPAGRMRALRKTFLAGLVLCLPLALTVYIVKALLELLAAPASNFVVYPILRMLVSDANAAAILDNPSAKAADLLATPLLEIAVTLVSAMLVVLVILAAGFVSRHLLGRVILDAMEDGVRRVPMINKVYHASKQMVDTFGSKADSFKEVVIVEYPRTGCRTIGFVSNRTPAARWSAGTGEEKLAHVFVPTAPNPTAGFVLLLPEKDLVPAGMSVAEGMKFVVSCGAVMP